jgi:hypothetical protein
VSTQRAFDAATRIAMRDAILRGLTEAQADQMRPVLAWATAHELRAIHARRASSALGAPLPNQVTT